MRHHAKLTVTLVACGLLCAAVARAADAPTQMFEVDREDTLAYHEPSSEAPVLRRLYLGELVKTVGRVTDGRGNAWLQVELGAATSGFVPESRLAKVGHLPASHWRPSKVVRDERPLGVAVRGLGETQGATLSLRYLPLTRLGLTMGLGAVLDRKTMRGRSLTVGLVSHPLLGRLSPVVEAGLASLAYDDGASTLHVLATYLTVGLEFMAEWGGYLSVGASFVRSVDIQVSYAWNDAHSGSAQPGSFGSMGSKMDGDVFQTVQPSLTLGYGF